MAGFLLDIIVTVYNGAEYIEDFFGRFAAQADPWARLVLVDDGSTDGTPALLDKCGEKSCFETLVIHQENAGISRARNAGIKASDAEYIAFFDIDDICAPDYVKELLDAIESGEGFDALVFKRQKLYGSEDAVRFGDASDGADRDKNARKPETGAVSNIGNDASDQIENKDYEIESLHGIRNDAVRMIEKDTMLREVLFDTERYGNIHNLMVKRALLDRFDIRMNTELAYYEDYDFMYRVLGRADKIAYLDRWLYGYVVKREGSVMAKYSPEKLRCLRVAKELAPIFEESAPEFAQVFKRYALARLYWSVLWQTALAAPGYGAFVRFVGITKGRVFMKRLGGFPEKKVRLLRALFLTSKPAYYLAARVLGRKYTAIAPTDEETIRAAADACPKP